MRKNKPTVEELSIDNVQLPSVSEHDEMSLWLEHVALLEEVTKKIRCYNRLSVKKTDIEKLSKTLVVISVLSERLKDIHLEMNKRLESLHKHKLN